MRLGLRVVGVLACVAAAIGIASVHELPSSLHAVAWKADPQGGLREHTSAPNTTVAWGDRDIVVAFLDPIQYDEARDATLAGAIFDGGHRPAAPLVWVHGRVGGAGPFLLKPSAQTLSFEDVDASASQFAGRFAIAEPFEARSSMPAAIFTTALHLAPLALFVFLADGGWVRRALSPMAVAFGGWMGFEAQAAGLGGLLHSFIAVIAVASGALMLLLLLFWRKRVGAISLAVFAGGIAYFLTIGIAAAYSPHSGAGD